MINVNKIFEDYQSMKVEAIGVDYTCTLDEIINDLSMGMEESPYRVFGDNANSLIDRKKLKVKTAEDEMNIALSVFIIDLIELNEGYFQDDLGVNDSTVFKISFKGKVLFNGSYGELKKRYNSL